MAQGPENRFIHSIHSKLPSNVYRMKNHNMYTGGIPDCWYSGVAGDLWIEYKYEKNDLSALQEKWITERRNEGRKVWVIYGNSEGGRVHTNNNSKGTQYTKAGIVALITGEVSLENSKKAKRNCRTKS